MCMDFRLNSKFRTYQFTMDLTWRFDVESGFDKIHDMEWTLAENVISNY